MQSGAARATAAGCLALTLATNREPADAECQPQPEPPAAKPLEPGDGRPRPWWPVPTWLGMR